MDFFLSFSYDNVFRLYLSFFRLLETNTQVDVVVQDR